WAGTAAPATVVGSVVGADRWCARAGPLSGAGSCRPSPDRQAEARSADRGRGPVMSGDGGRIGSLLLQGITPMLDAPLAGVGGIHPDHADTAAGGHGGQPGAEPAGGDTSNGAAQLLAASAAAQGFAPSRA